MAQAAIALNTDDDDFSMFGEAHNDYLDYLATKPNFGPNQKEENFEYGKSYEDGFSGNIQNINWDEYQSHLNYDNQLIEIVMNGGTPSTKLLEDNKVSADMAAFLDELATIYQNAVDTPKGTYYSIQQFKDAVNLLEDKVKRDGNIIFNSSTFEGNDNAAKLAVCEVAKSSYSYWITVAEGRVILHGAIMVIWKLQDSSVEFGMVLR